jgi:uncharacterized membrane protein
MQINRVSDLSPDILKARVLWEDNMLEPWDDSALADKFVVVDADGIVGGFAVYWDESDGIAGHYCSGWAKHGAHVPTDRILKQLVSNVGDVYFKTDKRTAKILLEKIGKRVKNVGRFGYFNIRRGN